MSAHQATLSAPPRPDRSGLSRQAGGAGGPDLEPLESAILGAALFDPSAALPIIESAGITPADLSPDGEVILATIRATTAERDPSALDSIQVMDALRRTGHNALADRVNGLLDCCPASVALKLPGLCSDFLASVRARRGSSLLQDAAAEIVQVRPEALHEYLDELRDRLDHLRPPTGGPAPWMDGALTAAEIGKMDLPEVRFIVEGLLTEGLSMLAGRPKLGKSWLAFSVALTVASGGIVLDRIRVDRGDVLFLALEDAPRRLKNRLAVLMGDEPLPGNLHFFTDWPRLDKGGLDRLTAWMDLHPQTRLIVIDTLQKVKAPAGRNANAYESDYAALSDLQRLASGRGVCILVIHHTRKAAAEDVLDTVSGSTGITGCVDTILVLARARGEADAVLHVTGRDVEESRLALRFSTGRWSMLGDAQDHEVSESRRKILAVLSAKPLTPKETAEATGLSHSVVRVLLGKMVEAGQLVRGDDHRYAALTVNSVNSNTPEVLTLLTCKGVNAVNGLSSPTEPPAWEGDV